MVNTKRIARVLMYEYGYDREEAMEIAEDIKEELEETMAETLVYNDYEAVENIFLDYGIDLDFVVECLI